LTNQDITNVFERLEAFEDRLGVRLEGLYAKIDRSGNVWVQGELHLREGTELNQDVDLVATYYDPSGRVLDVQTRRFDSSAFFAFEPFKMVANINEDQSAKIRIYPKSR
jgi:hypothetical protein